MKPVKESKRPRFEKGGYPQPVLPERFVKPWTPPKSVSEQKDTDSS